MKPPEPHNIDNMKEGLRRWQKGKWGEKFLVVEDLVRGRGIVATHDIKKAEFVLEYEFNLLTVEQAKLAEEVYKREGLGCFIINAKWEKKPVCLDGTLLFHTLGRLVNHASRDPNLEAFRLVELEPGQGPRLALFSTRAIPKGQELMWDYGDFDVEGNFPWIASECPRAPHPSFLDQSVAVLSTATRDMMSSMAATAQSALLASLTPRFHMVHSDQQDAPTFSAVHPDHNQSSLKVSSMEKNDAEIADEDKDLEAVEAKLAEAEGTYDEKEQQITTLMAKVEKLSLELTEEKARTTKLERMVFDKTTLTKALQQRIVNLEADVMVQTASLEQVESGWAVQAQSLQEKLTHAETSLEKQLQRETENTTIRQLSQTNIRDYTKACGLWYKPRTSTDEDAAIADTAATACWEAAPEGVTLGSVDPICEEVTVSARKKRKTDLQAQDHAEVLVEKLSCPPHQHETVDISTASNNNRNEDPTDLVPNQDEPKAQKIENEDTLEEGTSATSNGHPRNNGTTKNSPTSPTVADTHDYTQQELTPQNFQEQFQTAVEAQDQLRGHHQLGNIGQFLDKAIKELSWRGLLKYFYRKYNNQFVLACQCDEAKLKNTAQAIIKHIERHHMSKNKDAKLVFSDLDKLNLTISEPSST